MKKFQKQCFAHINTEPKLLTNQMIYMWANQLNPKSEFPNNMCSIGFSKESDLMNF